jgi:hypothetical protein
LGQGGVQARFERIQPRVSGCQVAVEGVRDQEQAAPGVVKGYQRVGQQEQALGQGQVPHGLIAQVAHQPADEARQARDVRRLVPGQLGLQYVQRVLARLHGQALHAPRAAPLDRAGSQPVLAGRVHADKGIARHALAALDRLQQERRPAPAQLQVDARRGLEIGRQLAHQRGGQGVRRGRSSEGGFGQHRLSVMGPRRYCADSVPNRSIVSWYSSVE